MDAVEEKEKQLRRRGPEVAVTVDGCDYAE